MKTAIFPGSFHPFTIGHADIVARGLEIFDRVIVCVGINPDKGVTEEEITRRVDAIRAVYAGESRVEVLAWDGLTSDLAASRGARFLLRGIRSVKDFEYERDLADANRALASLETVVLMARPELAWVSSSLVRELQRFGRDTGQLTPGPSPLTP